MTMLRTIHTACAALIRSVMPHGKRTARARHGIAALKEKRIRPTHTAGHTAFLHYRDETVRSFIHAMKYEKDAAGIRYAAELLRDCLSHDCMRGPMSRGDRRIICTVPVTKTRKRKDGYDHIRAVLDAYFHGTPDTDIEDGRDTLLWRRRVERQSSMKNRAERLRNMDGAMEAAPGIREDAVYIVFDDVMTTGATLTEARRALSDGGARTVITVALAH